MLEKGHPAYNMFCVGSCRLGSALALLGRSSGVKRLVVAHHCGFSVQERLRFREGECDSTTSTPVDTILMSGCVLGHRVTGEILWS